MPDSRQVTVLIAGIGGASLGTELMKCLQLAGPLYRVYGCDISPVAFGHSAEGFADTFVVDARRYQESVLRLCLDKQVDVVVPGGEQPLRLLGEIAPQLAANNTRFAANSAGTAAICCDKYLLAGYLHNNGFRTPVTLDAHIAESFSQITYPCIVKPARDSGGSANVFLADCRSEAELYAHYISANGRPPILQQYLPHDDGGEFTVGVLSLTDGSVYGSVALRRVFDSKLSVAVRTKTGLISSGNSQGLFDAFPEVCQMAERIARAVGSRGPLNVQGRLCSGVFVPFEINPRFSASTFLRALAGFREVDVFLRHLCGLGIPPPEAIRPGYYLRSFTETYVPLSDIVRRVVY